MTLAEECADIHMHSVSTEVSYCNMITSTLILSIFSIGCVYGGNLTAMVLPEEQLVVTPAKKRYFKPRIHVNNSDQSDSSELQDLEDMP